MSTKKDKELEIFLKSLTIKYQELMREVDYLTKQIELKRKKRALQKRDILDKGPCERSLKNIDIKAKEARRKLAQNLKTLNNMKNMHKKNIIRLREMIARIQYIEKEISKSESSNLQFSKGNSSKISVKTPKTKKTTIIPLKNKKKPSGKIPNKKEFPRQEEMKGKNSPSKIKSFKDELKKMLSELSLMRKKRIDIIKDADNLKN